MTSADRGTFVIVNFASEVLECKDKNISCFMINSAVFTNDDPYYKITTKEISESLKAYRIPKAWTYRWEIDNESNLVEEYGHKKYTDGVITLELDYPEFSFKESNRYFSEKKRTSRVMVKVEKIYFVSELSIYMSYEKDGPLVITSKGPLFDK